MVSGVKQKKAFMLSVGVQQKKAFMQSVGKDCTSRIINIEGPDQMVWCMV